MPNTGERSSKMKNMNVMTLIKTILMECQDKSLIILGSRENVKKKEIGNCVFRQVLRRSIAVNGEQRNEMIAGWRNESRRKFFSFLRWKK